MDWGEKGEENDMSFFEEYSRIPGLLAFTFVFIILLSTPSTLFAKSITMIDTALSPASKDAMLVRAKMDFGGNEHMRAFPNEIGDWSELDYKRGYLRRKQTGWKSRCMVHSQLKHAIPT